MVHLPLPFQFLYRYVLQSNWVQQILRMTVTVATFVLLLTSVKMFLVDFLQRDVGF